MNATSVALDRTGAVATLRIAAVLRGLHLPIFNLRDDGGSK